MSERPSAPTLPTMTLSQYLALLNEGLGHQVISHYGASPRPWLAQLCDKYGSDKGEAGPGPHPYDWPSHSYADYYARLFDHCRRHIRTVFECGLGTNNPTIRSTMGVAGRPGASLRMWREYFPNARIVGADIDADILFQEERIETYQVDQTDPASIRRLWDRLPDVEFDFMLDDGLHTYEAAVVLFENSIHKLAPDGVYIIEDVRAYAQVGLRKYFADKNYRVEYVNLLRPNLPLQDNNLVVIRRP